MCGRYANTLKRLEIERKLAPIVGLALSWHDTAPAENAHIKPTQQVLLARTSEDALHLAGARWGLVPSWSKNIASRPLINARVETILDKPSFRSAIRKRRVILPATRYFEWQRRDDGTKQVFGIAPESGEPAWMGGVLEWWRDPANPESPLMPSVAIITTDAAVPIAHVHDRSPLMIADDLVADWLDPHTTERSDVADLLGTAGGVTLVAEPTDLPT